MSAGDPDLPHALLEQVYWSSDDTIHPDHDAFQRAVRTYQVEISSEDTWRPDEVVLRVPRIRACFMCWVDGDELEPVLTLVARDGVQFTAGDLLFALCNAIAGYLREHGATLSDHHFFEGLTAGPAQPGNRRSTS
jgi:hypothetical protein